MGTKATSHSPSPALWRTGDTCPSLLNALFPQQIPQKQFNQRLRNNELIIQIVNVGCRKEENQQKNCLLENSNLRNCPLACRAGHDWVTNRTDSSSLNYVVRLCLETQQQHNTAQPNQMKQAIEQNPKWFCAEAWSSFCLPVPSSRAVLFKVPRVSTPTPLYSSSCCGDPQA